MRLIAALAVVLVALSWWLGLFDAARSLAAGWQRGFQDALGQTVRAIQQGDSAAFWTLVAAAAGYGLAHAAGPGHGKVLIGGVSLARAPVRCDWRCCRSWPAWRRRWWPSFWSTAGWPPSA